MSVFSNMDELHARLDELERENRSLKRRLESTLEVLHYASGIIIELGVSSSALERHKDSLRKIRNTMGPILGVKRYKENVKKINDLLGGR